jgi:hypothetical protein
MAIAPPVRGYPAQSAFMLAQGPARGPVMMSWSPDGHILAIVDGNARASTPMLMVPTAISVAATVLTTIRKNACSCVFELSGFF